MIVVWSIVLFIILTGVMYLLGVNVWMGSKTVIDRVSGANWQNHEAAHPSLVFRDLLEKLGNLVPASPKDVSTIQKRLMRAGIRSPLALKTFYGLKAGLVVLLPILAFLGSLRVDFDSSNRVMLLAAGGLARADSAP